MSWSVKELSHPPVPSLDQNFPFRTSCEYLFTVPFGSLNYCKQMPATPKTLSSSLHCSQTALSSLFLTFYPQDTEYGAWVGIFLAENIFCKPSVLWLHSRTVSLFPTIGWHSICPILITRILITIKIHWSLLSSFPSPPTLAINLNYESIQSG